MAEATQSAAHNMLMLTARTKGGVGLANHLEHMKKQLKLCLQLGPEVPAIWIRASGRASEAEAASTRSLVGIVEQELLVEVCDLLKLIPQPIFGIATGVVDAPAGLLLKACDYVFAEVSSRFMPTMETGQAEGILWPQSFCIDAQEAEAVGLVDVALETKMLHERCQKTIHQISQLRSKKLVELKKVFQDMKLHKQHCLKKATKATSRSSTWSTEMGSITERDEEE